MYIFFTIEHNSLMEQLMRSLVVSKHGEDLHFPISSPPVSPLPLPFCFLARKQRDLQDLFLQVFLFFIINLRVETKEPS